MQHTLVLTVFTLIASVGLRAESVNLLVNPNFDMVYAAQRQTSPDATYHREDHGMLPKFADGKSVMPCGWVLQVSKDEAATAQWVQEGGVKALRLTVPKGESVRLIQGYIEVIPGAMYDIGLSVKGSGHVDLYGFAGEPAPDEWLASIGAEASAEWKKLHVQRKIGPHRHLARVCYAITGPADLTVRQAEFSTQTSAPAPACPLSGKYSKDADTIFYEDFDGPVCSVSPKADTKLTEKDGGRFGRGLITSSKNGGATTRLPFGDLPEKGTIEFWFKPASLPVAGPGNVSYSVPMAVTTQTPGLEGTQTQIEFELTNWCATVAFGFRQQYRYDRANWGGGNGPGWGWWQKDTWHHIAGAWDGDCMRVYVDGVMESTCYGKDKMFPRGKAVDLVLSADGVVDEIRISKCLRYGPVIPDGAKPVLYSLATVSEVPPAPAAKESSEDELAGERAKQLSPVPASKADYTYGIDQLRPGWEGMSGMKVQKDYFGKGIDAMESQGQREPGKCMYWRVGKIEAGQYYVGVWTDTFSGNFKTEYGPEKLLASAYLNGWPVRFSTATDPVQVRPGVWLAELQTGEAVALKEGDEIALWPTVWADKQCFLRLALYKKQPSRGHGITGQTFGPDCGNPQRLRLVLTPEIRGNAQDGSEHEAVITVANPLPYAVDTEVTWKLADYYGTPVEKKAETLHLDAHSTKVISRKFTANGDAIAYQLDVRSRPAEGFKFPVPRPVEMLPLSDYSFWEFLPNQPSPLTAWNHTRLDLAEDRTGERKLLRLDGNDWEWTWLDGRRVPATVPGNLVWNKGSVPSTEYWIKPPAGRFGKWFRKSITVPDWFKGQRYLLEIVQAQTEATVFLNGKRVGYGVGALPVAADLGDAVKLGQPNELVICVRGGIAVVDDAFVDQFDLENWRVNKDHEDVYHDSYGVPCIKSVFLRTLPEVRVKQSLVIADTEAGKIKVMTRVENRSAQARKLTVKFAVSQDGKPIAVGLEDKALDLAPGAVSEFTVDASGDKLRQWTPRDPVLSKLMTTVTEDGKPLDTFDRRFGYRDMKIKGENIYLNGKRTRLFGACLLPSAETILEGDTGLNFFRSQGEGADLWDEIGMPYLYCVYECGDKNWRRLNNQKYWDSWYNFLAQTGWDQGSRAGVVGWDISCETFYTLYTSGKEGQEKDFDRIYGGAQMLRKLWPKYFCVADGDGSLNNRLDFASYHYWNQYSGGMKLELGGGFTYDGDGLRAFYPDGFFANGAAREPKKGTVFHMSPDWVYGSSACGSTEDYEFFGPQNGVPGFARYIGDRSAVSAASTWNDPRGMAWVKMSTEGKRDMDMAVPGCVYWNSFFNLADEHVSFVMPQQEIRYYSGAKFDKRITLFDDDYQPGKLEFRWALLDGAGKPLRSDSIAVQTDTCTLYRDRLAFDLPQVIRRTSCVLDMKIFKDGQLRAHEQRVVEVWPSLGKVEAAEAWFVLFDPAKSLTPAMERLGVRAKTISAIDAAALKDAKALVVAPDCVTPAMVENWPVVRDFVQGGGRVLILHQDNTALLPTDVSLDAKFWMSVGFVRTPNHPVMKDLQDRDFQMWNPGHVIAKGAFRKPGKGACLTLVDSGHDESTPWAETLELYIGKGSIVATQLALTDDFATEPMAAHMLQRLLAYLGQPVFRAPGRSENSAPLAVLSGATETMLKRLNEVRADYAVISAPAADSRVTLVDLSSGKAPDDAAPWRAYVQQGGTLLLHRASPKHQVFLESLTGKKVQVQVQPYASWVDRQILERRDGLVAGLDNLDLYWRTQTPGEGYEDHWQVSCGLAKGLERGQVQYVVRVEGADDYLYPGGLVEVSMGKGRLIIDQLKWDMPGKDMVCGSPLRVISMLLTNLGVSLRLPAAKPVLPKGVTYEMIDLSSVVNRSFKDDKAGDGEGWLDWGPDADLRSFPTGDTNIGGVPYKIAAGDKNAIVLRVNPEWVRCLEKYPDTVVIPVNKKRAAGLLFLHTGGWAAGLAPFGERRVEYDDGTREVIRMNQTNMADWNPGIDNFPNEEGTTTIVAWKGANTQYPTIRVYQTLWVNPHPEKTIKQVVLTNAGLPVAQLKFIPHLGLTAAILPADAKLPAAGDPEKSRKLFLEAQDLIEKKQAKEADAKLQASLEADSTNTAAWVALTDLRAATDSIEAFTALCRRWQSATPRNFQAHNVLGRFLEGKGKLQDALAEYRESIKIDQNQPPTLADIQRVEAKLKQR